MFIKKTCDRIFNTFLSDVPTPVQQLTRPLHTISKMYVYYVNININIGLFKYNK